MSAQQSLHSCESAHDWEWETVHGRFPSRRSCAHCGAEQPDGACETIGHEWANAGDGLLICMACDAEKWDD